MSSEGSVFKRGDGKWCGKYKDSTGKWKYLYRGSKQETRAALEQAIRDRNDGYTTSDKLTLSHAVEAWLENTQDTVSTRTYNNNAGLARNHISSHAVGSVRLSKLTEADVRRLYRDKLENLSPGTVGKLHSIMKAVCKGAVRSKYIRTNPMENVKQPKQVHVERDVLTAEQVKHLLETVRGHRWECVYVLGALCGLRSGEALGLRWEDIDLEAGTIQVRRTVWQYKASVPKTPSSRRRLQLPALALDALTRHSEPHGNPKQGWLSPTKNGNPTSQESFYTWGWKPALRKAGLPSSTRFHDLRHGAASLLINQGVPIPVVSKYLGHANPAITMRVYAHMIDGTSGMAASAMDSVLADGDTRHLRAL